MAKKKKLSEDDPKHPSYRSPEEVAKINQSSLEADLNYMVIMGPDGEPSYVGPEVAKVPELLVGMTSPTLSPGEQDEEVLGVATGELYVPPPPQAPESR